jgi:peptidyl-prolyl cis-trans isomerase B (cyclophilin B)
MHVDYPLPYSYTIFGKVIDGLDVIDTIASVETGAGDKPVEDVVIESVEISEN